MNRKGIKIFKAWMLLPALVLIFALNGQGNAQVQGPEVIGPVTPGSFDGDLRDLPEARTWQAGDPIIIRPEGLLPEGNDVPRGKSNRRLPAPEFTIDPALDGGSADSPDAFTPGLNFAGIGFGGVYPPDTVGDVGPNHYIQMVNDVNGSRFQIWNKNGVSLAGPTVLQTLWTLGGACADGLGDPIVLYDHLANRWLMSEFASTGSHLCIYISKTADPVAGGWWLYDFTVPTFPDYPKYGVWPDAYYVSTYEGANLGLFALNRTQMLAGAAATSVRFTIPSLTPVAGVRETRILPADLDGPAPPAGAPNYYFRPVEASQDVNNPVDRLEVFEFHVDFVTPANSTFTLVSTLAPAAFALVPCSPGIRDCIPQPGTTMKLDALTNRPMHRLQYRNFDDHQTLVTNQTVDAGGRAGIRWYELRKTTGAWSIRQQGTYSPDSNYRWMGSIAMDALGNMALGYSVSSASVYPSIRYTGRKAGDPLGTMTQGETTVIAGTASQTVTQRWGDYSNMSPDPARDCHFWYTQQYIPAGGNWTTRINSFGFPGCGFSMCLKDPLYGTQYWLNIEDSGMLLRGAALYPGLSSFPAPITGVYDPSSHEATLSIDYRNQSGLRFYRLNVGPNTGESWGIYDSDSRYYDGPRAASLVSCPVAASQLAEEETGAAK
jgi:hypothetical protein